MAYDGLAPFPRPASDLDVQIVPSWTSYAMPSPTIIPNPAVVVTYAIGAIQLACTKHMPTPPASYATPTARTV